MPDFNDHENREYYRRINYTTKDYFFSTYEWKLQQNKYSRRHHEGNIQFKAVYY